MRTMASSANLSPAPVTPENLWKVLIAKSDEDHYEIPENCRSSFLAFVRTGRREEFSARASMWMDAAKQIKFAKDSVPLSQAAGTSATPATENIYSISAPWYPGSMIVTAKAPWVPKKFDANVRLPDFDQAWTKLQKQKQAEYQPLTMPEVLDLCKRVVKATGFKLFPDPWMTHLANFVAKGTSNATDWQSASVAIETRMRMWLDAITNVVSPLASNPPS